MHLTMSSEMGIHAVWFLATVGGEEPLLSTTIAQGLKVSETYLIKVLKKMVAAKILGSRKGRSGGFFLRKQPDDITLADVVYACEGLGDIFDCGRDNRACGMTDHRCPVHQALEQAQKALYDELRKFTIGGLMLTGWPVALPTSIVQEGES